MGIPGSAAGAHTYRVLTWILERFERFLSGVLDVPVVNPSDERRDEGDASVGARHRLQKTKPDIRYISTAHPIVYRRSGFLRAFSSFYDQRSSEMSQGLFTCTAKATYKRFV